MKPRVTYYMHTLDGKPAFYDGQQVCFAMPGGYVRCGQWLCRSLDEIRSQWQASELWRSGQGLRPDYAKHGYVRVHLPETPDAEA